MGGCQNYGPFWGTLNKRCRIIIRTQRGTIILTTTHIYPLKQSKTKTGAKAARPDALGETPLMSAVRPGPRRQGQGWGFRVWGEMAVFVMFNSHGYAWTYIYI